MSSMQMKSCDVINIPETIFNKKSEASVSESEEGMQEMLCVIYLSCVVSMTGASVHSDSDE